MKINIEKYKKRLFLLEIKAVRWLKNLTLPGFHGKPLYDVLVYFIQGFSKGYLTDRGRVYLQYGAPNDVKSVPSDPVTLPYEIWDYYYLNNQSNVKFVFYDPVLTGNDYELLHSNLYGEVQNPNWRMHLVRKIQTQQDIYDPNPVDYWGNDMDDYWKYH